MGTEGNESRPRDDVFYVQGPSAPLTGRFLPPGCKNTALPSLVLAALAPGPVAVERVPRISDVEAMLDILRCLGAQVTVCGSTAIVKGPAKPVPSVPAELSQRLRGSLYALALFAVRGEGGSIGPIGGDQLAGRSLAPHARALAGFGCDLVPARDGWQLRRGRARAGDIVVDDHRMSATNLAVLIAASIEGRSVIREAATEAEVDDLLAFVRSCGAYAVREAPRTLVVEGPLTDGERRIALPSDQLAWGTFAIAASVTGGSLESSADLVERGRPILEALDRAGVDISLSDTLRTSGFPTRGIHVQTGMYPRFFPTDLLPPLSALCCVAPGVSVLQEGQFEGRFDHVAGLRRLGAAVEVHGRVARIEGPCQLQGATVAGSGIRETAALIVAGLAARGTTTVRHAGSVHRGYEAFAATLADLGANIICA